MIEYTLRTETVSKSYGAIRVYTLYEKDRLIIQTTHKSIVEAIIRGGRRYAID